MTQPPAEPHARPTPGPARLRFAHRAIAVAIGALALALCTPSLDDGLLLDDHMYTRLIDAHLRGDEVPGRWFELAGVRSSEGASVAGRIDRGQLPFWSDPGLSWAMFRPLAVLTHYFDMWAYPGTPWLMHLQNLCWYGALLWLLHALYRRLMPDVGSALLALAIFAFASGHLSAVAWLATRNAVMVAVFGAASLLLHLRAKDALHRGASALCLLLSLWSSEGGIALWAYFGAHALFEREARGDGDTGWLRTRLHRVRQLWPQALVSAGWLLHYRLLGFGARGGEGYLDPLTDPLGFAAVVPRRMWLLCEGLFGLPGMHALPLASLPLLANCVAAVSLAVLGLLAVRDRILRTWLVGCLVSLLPLCAALPGPRMLLLPAVGGAAAVALGMRRLWSLTESLTGPLGGSLGGSLAGPLELPARALCGVWLAVHLPQQLAVNGDVNAPRLAMEARLRSLATSLPVGSDRTLLVVNTPDFVSTIYATVYASDDPFAERQQYTLCAHGGPVVVSRPSHHSLRLRPQGGYLLEPSSRAFRSSRTAFVPGQRVPMGPATATIEEVTVDGRPLSVRFNFADIGDSALRWVTVAATHDGLRARAFSLPAVGRSVLLQ